MRSPAIRSGALLAAAVVALAGCSGPTADAAARPAASAAPGTSAPEAASPVRTPTPTATPTTPSAANAPSASVSPSSSLSPSASVSPSGPVPATVVAGPTSAGTFVLGDSIILGAGVGPRLAAYGYTVVGVVGQSATESYLRTHLSSPAAQSAHSWVIELGTNNAGTAADVARLAGLVDVVASLRRATDPQRVYWVTPYRPVRGSDDPSANALDPFIVELARLAAERRWLRLIDWAGTARLHPEWFASDSMRLHPDATGQAVLLALIAGPDARPVTTPSPLLAGDVRATPEADPGPEPPVFDNRTLPATPTATPSPTVTPSPTAESAPDQVSPAQMPSATS